VYIISHFSAALFLQKDAGRKIPTAMLAERSWYNAAPLLRSITMRHVAIALVLVAIVGLGLFASRGPAAPALTEKPVKWEYAELQHRPFAMQQAGGAAMMGAGGRVGVVIGGPPPAPGLPAAPAPQPTPVVFVTADEEIQAPDWKAMADKLKAPAAKGEGSGDMHRLRILNRLSADGWEIYEHPSTYVWTFRRRMQ